MKIGPTFYNELVAAGLAGLPFAWDAEAGTFTFDPTMTEQQIAGVLAVYAAHDPTRTTEPNNYPAMIRYKADKLEASGDALGALKLRLSIGEL